MHQEDQESSWACKTRFPSSSDLKQNEGCVIGLPQATNRAAGDRRTHYTSPREQVPEKTKKTKKRVGARPCRPLVDTSLAKPFRRLSPFRVLDTLPPLVPSIFLTPLKESSLLHAVSFSGSSSSAFRISPLFLVLWKREERGWVPL